MRHKLLVSTALLACSAVATAETPIDTKRTAPVRTSTVNNGNADSIKIGSAGSVELTSGTAVTMDSNHGVTVDGKIIVTNANGGSGIDVNAGTTGDIIVNSSGVITVDETYVATDTDNDGDLDGPFAVGSNRFGIRTLGAHSGKLTQNGTITVEGNDSTGIALGGPLTGAFAHDGKTIVVGDRSVGIQAGAITGNVRLAGQVSATGADAVGARFGGDVTGAMVVQGSISSTGYRYTTAPADPSKLDPDDLRQGGSALVIEGNVTGGVILAIPPKDASPTNNDEDADGIEDSKEGSATVVSNGSAPAMVIGATNRAVNIGAIAGTGTGYGVQIDGTVAGNGVYSGVAGTALQIGGRGGAMTIAGGIGIGGTVVATAKDANATAVLIGSGASVPEIRVSGTVSASGGSTAASTSTAILVDTGGNLPTIRNSGTIKATAGGTAATAVAILDRTGGVTLIENSGAISATGATADSGRNVAIDLTANSSGVTIRQTAVTTGVTAPTMTGDVKTGSGNDLFDIADGTVTGTVTLGIGNDRIQLSGDAVLNGKALFGAGHDTLTLSGTSVFSGSADFGGSGTDQLSLANTARFSGSLLNAGQLAVAVSAGTLDLSAPSTIGSLNIASGGILVATLDKDAGQGTAITVGGTATFASGAVLQLKVADIGNAEGRYTVLSASTLTGASGITTKTDYLPFLFKATLATNAPANQLAVDVARKTTSELGLNRSQSSAWNAVYAAAGADADIGGVFVNAISGDQFRATLDQILPEHAGGSFRAISQGARALGRQARDPAGPVELVEGFRIALTEAGWGSNKAQGASQPYDNSGFGLGALAEIETGVGSFGVNASWMSNETKTRSSDNQVSSNSYMFGANWRGNWGAFAAYAQGAYGFVDFDSSRYFVGQAAAKKVERTTTSKWSGNLLTFSAGASAEGGGRAFFYRPSVQIDYVKLTEDGHVETGGGSGLNLTIGDRDSDELAIEGGLTLGIDSAGMSRRDTDWFRVEAEGGWRSILSGSIGSTTARFGTAMPFTLLADQGTDGWFGRLRAIGGNSGFQLGGELGLEDSQDKVGFTLRSTLRLAF